MREMDGVEMTGAPIRIERDGQWVAVDIDELTDKELADFIENAPDSGWAWVRFLVGWIRDNVEPQEKIPSEPS